MKSIEKLAEALSEFQETEDAIFINLSATTDDGTALCAVGGHAKSLIEMMQHIANSSAPQHVQATALIREGFGITGSGKGKIDLSN